MNGHEANGQQTLPVVSIEDVGWESIASFYQNNLYFVRVLSAP